MRIKIRKDVIAVTAFAVVVVCCYMVFSGAVSHIISEKIERSMPDIKERLYHHILTLQVDARHYFLFSPGEYKIDLFTEPLSIRSIATILYNSAFSLLFQPVFLCPFTPQVIINLVLLPFFIYASVRYFHRVFILLAVFVMTTFQIGIYDSGVEALIRHGMLCELIYLLIGTAGFSDLILKNSY